MGTPVKKVLVTGGAGFIGSALCELLLSMADTTVIALDSMTYAANPRTLEILKRRSGFQHIDVDICDTAQIGDLFRTICPDNVFHLAAETHVDRSIDGPAAFIKTNLIGTYSVLEAARSHYASLEAPKKDTFRFIHVSTDEVFGSLESSGSFNETSSYAPSSPYSASKAGADHLVRAWYHTYGLPVIVSNCSNNYGPRQFPEKLIPLMILNALEGRALPVYGDGGQVRDWLHVSDHARALVRIAEAGQPGEVYCVGAIAERKNIDIVRDICRLLDQRRPLGQPHETLIRFVADRPGHDRRYAIDPSKITTQLGWAPLKGFSKGLEETVDWYLSNDDWWRPLREQRYDGQRMGLLK